MTKCPICKRDLNMYLYENPLEIIYQCPHCNLMKRLFLSERPYFELRCRGWHIYLRFTIKNYKRINFYFHRWGEKIKYARMEHDDKNVFK